MHPGVLVTSWFKSKWRQFVFFILTGSENKPKWKLLFNGKDPDEAPGELILYFELSNGIFKKIIQPNFIKDHE